MSDLPTFWCDKCNDYQYYDPNTNKSLCGH